VLGYTIAAEIGDIERFRSPAKLIGYSGLCRDCPTNCV
jgi:transposase